MEPLTTPDQVCVPLCSCAWDFFLCRRYRDDEILAEWMVSSRGRNREGEKDRLTEKRLVNVQVNKKKRTKKQQEKKRWEQEDEEEEEDNRGTRNEEIMRRRKEGRERTMERKKARKSEREGSRRSWGLGSEAVERTTSWLSLD